MFPTNKLLTGLAYPSHCPTITNYWLLLTVLPALSDPHCMLLRQTCFADALLYFRNVIFGARRVPRFGGAIVNGIRGARVAVARLTNGARIDDQSWFKVHRRA